jgi:hypothetical protein
MSGISRLSSAKAIRSRSTSLQPGSGFGAGGLAYSTLAGDKPGNSKEEYVKEVREFPGPGITQSTRFSYDYRDAATLKEFKTTVRNIPLVDEYDGPGKCIVTGETVDKRALIAKAY